MALEGWSTIGNIRELNRRRGEVPFVQYLRETKDSDLIIVFGENSAAVLGLCFAILALVLAKETGDGRWDGAGSLVIGLVLLGVATFLGREVKSLLVGEAADPRLVKVCEELAALDPDVDQVLRVLALQQGPGEIVVAMKLKMRADLMTRRAGRRDQPVRARAQGARARGPVVVHRAGQCGLARHVQASILVGIV